MDEPAVPDERSATDQDQEPSPDKHRKFEQKSWHWWLAFAVPVVVSVVALIRPMFVHDNPPIQLSVNLPSLPKVGDSPGQPAPQINSPCDGTADAGWGPPRPTVQGPTTYLFYPGFNADRLNPNIGGDERDMVGVRPADTHDPFSTGTRPHPDGSNAITVQDGARYRIRMYIGNSASDSDDTVATGTRVRIPLPACFGKHLAINGYIHSADAFPVEVWGGVNLKSDRPFKVSYVPDSAVLETNGFPGGNGASPGIKITGTEFLSEPGQLVGYNQLDGNVRGSWQYSEYFSIEVKVTMT